MPYKELVRKNPSIDDLIDELKKYYHKADIDMVRLAYDFAAKAHEGQTRKSGEPYIVHPLAAAFILAQMRIDVNLIIAALLHDVPEDTPITLDEIEKNFGKDIASMIKGITKLGKLKYRGVERYIENLRKMFVAMAEDIRVMILKFADRVHNLSTLDALPPKKRYRIALESLEIYAPIANRLGIGEFKSLLEDLAFPYVFPKEYARTKALRESALAAQSEYLETIMKKIGPELKNAGITVISVHGRQKTLYSLYQKIIKKYGWEEADKIYDIEAIRIIVEDVGDCYAALGIIHKLWRPLKGRIKDYISQPKPNGYKSLHTTVFCDDGKVVEFQIRDRQMHSEAEYGVAAHWHYDEKGSRLPAKDVDWAKELAAIQKNVIEKISDLDELKVDFFRNRIFVFTPQGDVLDLPEDATPVDFAYHVHTDIGNHCNGAKVNDQLVSLDTALRSGDVVEIVVDKNRKGPSQDWLKHVKTHLAKSRIKASLKNEKRTWLKIIPIPKFGRKST
jgi:guanosine-3',5'-bis(diphosphate) 3'-pyrophosphohydrolase